MKVEVVAGCTQCYVFVGSVLGEERVLLGEGVGEWAGGGWSDLEQSCVSRGAEDTEPGSVEGSNHRDVGDWPGNPQSSEAALRPPTQESEGPYTLCTLCSMRLCNELRMDKEQSRCCSLMLTID